MVELLTVEALKEQLAKKLKLAPGEKFPSKLGSKKLEGVYNTFLRDYALATGMDNIHIKKDGKHVIKGAILDKLGKQIADIYNAPTVASDNPNVVLAKYNRFITLPADVAQAAAQKQVAAAEVRLATEPRRGKPVPQATVKNVKLPTAVPAVAVEATAAPTVAPPDEKFQYMRVEAKTANKNIDAMLLQMGVVPSMPEYASKKAALQKEMGYQFGKANKGGLGHKNSYLKIAPNGSYVFTQNTPMAEDNHTVALNLNNATKAGKTNVWQATNDGVVEPATIKAVETLLPLNEVLQALVAANVGHFDPETKKYDFFGPQQFDKNVAEAVKKVLQQYPEYIDQNLSGKKLHAAYMALANQANQTADVYLNPLPPVAKQKTAAVFEPINDQTKQKMFVNNAGNLTRVVSVVPPVIAAAKVAQPEPEQVPDAVVVDEVPEVIKVEEELKPLSFLTPLSFDEDKPDNDETVVEQPIVKANSFFNKAWKKAVAVAATVAIVGSMVFAGVSGAFKKADTAKPKDNVKNKTTIVAKAVTPPVVATDNVVIAKPKVVDIDSTVKVAPLPAKVIGAPAVAVQPAQAAPAETKTFGEAFAQARQKFVENTGPDTFSHPDKNGQVKKYTTDTKEEVLEWFKDEGLKLTGYSNADYKKYLEAGRPYKNVNRQITATGISI